MHCDQAGCLTEASTASITDEGQKAEGSGQKATGEGTTSEVLAAVYEVSTARGSGWVSIEVW